MTHTTELRGTELRSTELRSTELRGAARLLELNWNRGASHEAYENAEARLEALQDEHAEFMRDSMHRLSETIAGSGRAPERIQEVAQREQQLKTETEQARETLRELRYSVMHADDTAPDAQLSDERLSQLREAQLQVHAGILSGNLKEVASRFMLACMGPQPRFSAAALRATDIKAARAALYATKEAADETESNSRLRQLDVAVLGQMMLHAADAAEPGQEEAAAAQSAMEWVYQGEENNAHFTDSKVETILAILPPALAALAVKSTNCAAAGKRACGAHLDPHIPRASSKWPEPVWTEQDTRVTKELVELVNTITSVSQIMPGEREA